MRITVIGCGRWGSLIAWYLDRTGHAVTLYGRPGSRHICGASRRIGAYPAYSLRYRFRRRYIA